MIHAITEWHYDRNLIDGTTSIKQTEKLLEEFLEVLAAQMPNDEPSTIAFTAKAMVQKLLHNGRIKKVLPEEAHTALIDGLGDMAVVAINIAEREGHSYTECMAQAYGEIKNRKGKMVQGTFVKEEDL